MKKPDPLHTARLCRHYAMCKIDFLGIGLCPPGKEKFYVSYFPQGRMDIYAALAEDKIPVTERLVDIADSCTLCGYCDKQCYFVTELRPLAVMKALKERVTAHLEEHKPVVRPEPDQVLIDLQEIVGAEWASSDPAILVSYAHDPGPFTGLQLPKYVVLPASTQGVSQVVKLCQRNDIPYAVRGNGSSVMGFVFSPDGLVLDLHRMQEIYIDRENWKASVGPGVSAFELQKRAEEHNLRANVAEPSALVCANIMCSGIFSTYSNAYGTAADTYVDAEFVDRQGNIFSLSQREAPNLFAFLPEELPTPGICTRADVRLHPKTYDERGLLVPCADFTEAANLAQDLAKRRIGLALAVLGLEYIATFMSPTTETGCRIKHVLRDTLGFEYAVLMIGDRYAEQAVRSMDVPVIDQETISLLTLGLPNLIEGDWLDIVAEGEGRLRPYEMLFRPEMIPMLAAALTPAPEALADTVAPDLRAFFRDLYSRNEMTDMVWLNDFRIISSRMGREKHVVAFIVYVPLDKVAVVEQINHDFRSIADSHSLKNDYGFLTPLDLGKRAVLEYDYYMDQTERDEIERMQQAVIEAGQMLERAQAEHPGVRWIKYVFNQGFSRKESFLYS